MLSDVEIREALAQGAIRLNPVPADSDIQPASIDVHLGGRFGWLRRGSGPRRLTEPSDMGYVDAKEITIEPRAFLLGQLLERVSIDNTLVARIEGKSSNGRKGLAIHVTAGFVDPGWDGILTVELYNASSTPYILREGDPIGQLAFDRLGKPSERPYGHEALGSHFQGDNEVRGA